MPYVIVFFLLATDTINPSLSLVSIASNNAVLSTVATLTNIISLTFRASEPLSALPVVQILGSAATVTQSVEGEIGAACETSPKFVFVFVSCGNRAPATPRDLMALCDSFRWAFVCGDQSCDGRWRCTRDCTIFDFDCRCCGQFIYIDGPHAGPRRCRW